MIEWLRFIGLLNASLWLGACLYHLIGVGPSLGSSEVQQILGPSNAPYFGTAIRQVVDSNFFSFQLVFALIAGGHMMAMWLYVGRSFRRPWQIVLGGLCLITLVQMLALQPKLRTAHLTRHSPRVTPQQRASAGNSFRAWQTVSFMFNLMQIAGLAGYFWRVANPSEATRFVSAVKFRS